MDGQIERIAAWLNQYVSYDGGLLPADKDSVRDGLMLLIDEKVMTIDEMRLEALKEYNVIIPWDLLSKEN